jgi:O-acetylserine/cysteine efflux transporter
MTHDRCGRFSLSRFVSSVLARKNFALVALIASGLMWGTTIPMTKIALEWLGPSWLTVARFAFAALLLAFFTRGRLREACTPSVFVWGAAGYGIAVVAQNAGVVRTSVSHAALLVGSLPVLVALIALAMGERQSVITWTGFAVALAGVAFFAAAGGGSASLVGDGLVMFSLVLAAAFVVAQPRLLAGRDPVAVTAVQFAAAALNAAPAAALLDRPPAAPSGIGPVCAVIALVVGGTLLPFTLFAYGQKYVAPEIAGAFLNLEPVVGAAVGFAVFDDPAGAPQLMGAVAVIAGIALSAAPLVWTPRGPTKIFIDPEPVPEPAAA